MIPGKQLFIPDLLVNLKRRESEYDLGDTIPPMAQCILLYHIQVKSIRGKTQEVDFVCDTITYTLSHRVLYL